MQNEDFLLLIILQFPIMVYYRIILEDTLTNIWYLVYNYIARST